jgi:exopolysaccharide biosynthesis polyprenyl glycosylphosphotransferase
MKSANIAIIMIISNKKETLLIFIGDLFIFAISLWISLALRNGDIPVWSSYQEHLIPFTFIFLAWILVFFIAGLYDKYTTILKDSMSGVIFNAQLVNSAIAIIFFYFIPYFGIAPKTILFLNLLVSFILIYTWRIYSHPILGLKRKESAIIIGSGEEMHSVLKEINENPMSELRFILSVDLDKEKDTSYINNIIQKIKNGEVSVLIVDLKDIRIESILPTLYNQIFSGVKFIDLDKVYESIFDRVPLSFLQYDWFLENISLRHDLVYLFFKRFLDIFISLIILIILVPFFPFIAIAIMLNTKKGKVIISQNRIGEGERVIKIHKFLTMLFDDEGDEDLRKKNHSTAVGKFLRKTRLDELPQAWNVIKGELSLIGPRPEMPLFVQHYEKEIPYYNIRHIIKPGLSGWAQICQNNPPKGSVNFNDTKTKLSYDLYYLKNKSITLDLNIALKTIKTLLSRKGK